MSVTAMAWGWLQAVDPTSKIVLIALCDHASEDGVCWVGMKLLEKKTCLSERSIVRATARLEALGMILKSSRFKDGRQLSNLWEVRISEVEVVARRVTKGQEGGDTVSVGRVSQCHPMNHQIEPTKEEPPFISPQGGKKKSDPPTEEEWTAYCQETWPDWPVAEAIQSWLYYQSVGWRTRAGAIKDWKAAARHSSGLRRGLQKAISPEVVSEIGQGLGRSLHPAPVVGNPLPDWKAQKIIGLQAKLEQAKIALRRSQSFGPSKIGWEDGRSNAEEHQAVKQIEAEIASLGGTA